MTSPSRCSIRSASRNGVRPASSCLASAVWDVVAPASLSPRRIALRRRSWTRATCCPSRVWVSPIWAMYTQITLSRGGTNFGYCWPELQDFERLVDGRGWPVERARGRRETLGQLAVAGRGLSAADHQRVLHPGARVAAHREPDRCHRKVVAPDSDHLPDAPFRDPRDQ